ncbi:Retrovirus-related Pol polyprotein from transposon TNT 1-94 [Morus notabilis]|uniref:Retrovirus-related Pol polyprotein from transposon TNT 1-94 n=1 Tax=Morus notabilis TaxID=981085 RepID=W9RD34_9ROSA|nr:Retrovirus-related Pol polyprotein from transposon TNT 1-94 [Morus notabilis]
MLGGTPTIYSDNQSAIHLCKNLVYHEKSKHIDVRHHFIREKVEDEVVKLEKVDTKENPSDMATKLITGYNVFDLVGKSLTALYVPANQKVAIGATVMRLLFFPLFYGCLHGPEFFWTEVPVTMLTCLLGLTNGYLTSVLMILVPKNVPLQHAETAGIVIVLLQVIGLASGSIISWFWVI